jgi:hypothetical protein
MSTEIQSPNLEIQGLTRETNECCNDHAKWERPMPAPILTAPSHQKCETAGTDPRDAPILTAPSHQKCETAGTDPRDIDENAKKDNWILEEYSVIVIPHVHLLPSLSGAHRQFVIDNENDHVKNYQEWAAGKPLTLPKNEGTGAGKIPQLTPQKIGEAYENKRKNKSKNNLYDSESICVTKNLEKFNADQPLKESIRDAMSKSKRGWDYGVPPKHKWKEPKK